MFRRFLPAALIGMMVWLCGTYCHAQGFVERLEPPALERGRTTRVTVIGSKFGRPLSLWSSLPAGTIRANPVGEATPSQVTLDVAVAADAPVGIFGVRLATEDGLGNAVLALIDDLPVRAVPEARGTAPIKTVLPVALWGRFREAAVDRFAIETSAGQKVSFEAVGSRLGKDVDPLVTIRDAKGRIVAERDNDAGLYFDCRFEHHFDKAGTYTVEMRDARFHGCEHGLYVLRMGRFPAARVAVPGVVSRKMGRADLRLPELGASFGVDVPGGMGGLIFGVVKRPGDEGSSWLPLEAAESEIIVHSEKGTTLEDGTPARVPAILCGVLEKPNQRHYYRLELTKGQRILVRAEARAFNSPADLEIALLDARGKELKRVIENPQKEEVVLEFNAGAPGVYALAVRDVNRDGSPAFTYRLDVRVPEPMVQIVAEVEGLTVPRGSYQPIPLTVSRSNYNGKIALSLLGAPPGITLTPSEIEAGASAVVCKLSASADALLGLGSLQIVGRLEPPAVGKEKEAAPPPPIVVTTRPLIDRQLMNVDLIPYALREDQRRLPPSLTDRLALQVTPPAPFNVELPEPRVTLGRYQHVEYPIVLTRQPGFDGPVKFSASGGQIAAKEEGRTRVHAEFTEGKGSIHSRILTNLIKHRVEVTAIGVQGGRTVALTRTFDLEVRAAFTIAAEPATLKLEPGAVAKVRLNVDRLKTFDADVTVAITPAPGLNLPEKIVIARGQASVDVEVKVDADRAPGKMNVNLNATAVVNGYEEEQRGRLLEVEVFKTPVKKK